MRRRNRSVLTRPLPLIRAPLAASSRRGHGQGRGRGHQQHAGRNLADITSRLVFDPETHSWIQQLHDAWSSSAPTSTFAAIRDRLLDQLDRLDNRVCTLSSFAKVAGVHDAAAETSDAARWTRLFSLATAIQARSSTKAGAATTERKRKYNETNRLRNLALVAALWSPRIVFHYGWNTASQVQMNMLRACATRYPRFSVEFRPRLNAVLLARHCQGIRDGKTKTLHERPLQPHRDLHLDALAAMLPDADAEKAWVTSTDGRVLVDALTGTTLREARPSHYQGYLLRHDCFGLLVGRFAQDTDAWTMMQSPASSSTAADEQAARIEPRPAAPASAAHAETYYSLASSPALHRHSVQSLEPQPELCWKLPTPPASSPSLPADSGSCLAADSGGCLAPVANMGRHPEAVITSASEPTQLYCVRETPEYWQCYVTSNGLEQLELAVPLSPAWQSSVDDWTFYAAVEAMSHAHPINPFFSWLISSDSHRSMLPVSPMSRPTPAGTTLRLGSSANFVAADSTSIEEVLHLRYLDMTIQLLQRTSHQLSLHNGWLSASTPWARVWRVGSDGLAPGRASSLLDADLLLLTSDEAMRAASSGQTFTKPLVIKESFSDTGMHTMDRLDRLWASATAAPPETYHPLQARDTIGISVQDAATAASGTESSDPATVAIDLPNITRSHRPLITMLPRFRLLESLSQRPTQRPLLDWTQVTGFTTLSLTGACSSPRLVGSAGVWMRNLEGPKFVSLVTEVAVLAQSEALAGQGLGWDPKESQRFMILEQDDVLLIPPGSRTIYTIYSPTRGVMEGGFFWDCLNLLDTLRIVEWMQRYDLSRQDSICRAMPQLIPVMEQLVGQDSSDFRGKQLHEEFMSEFGRIVSRLRQYATASSEA